MRRELINWLVEVNVRFQLDDWVISSSVDLLDWVLYKKFIPVENLQLLGITSVMIFSKIFDINPPLLSDFL